MNGSDHKTRSDYDFSVINSRVRQFPKSATLAKKLGVLWTLIAALALSTALTSNSAADTLTFQQGVGGYAGLKQTTLFQFGAGASSVNGGLAAGTWTVDGGSGAYDDGQFKHGLIGFDNIFGGNPGQIPFGSTITSATITANYDDISTSDFAVYRMLQTWSPGTATWNGFTAGVQNNGTEAAVAATTTFSNPNGNLSGTYNAYGTSLTADLQLFSNGTANLGWVVLPTSGNSGWGWTATQTNSPVLSVTFTPPATALAATLTSPAAGATVGQSFTITASATAVSPATVASVTFKDGDTVLGVDTMSPYSWNVTGATPGSHTLTAVVTDSTTATATSAPVSVTVVTPILIGPSGSEVQTFGTAPSTTRWATLSVAGAAADVTSAGGIDSAMASIAAGNIITALGSQAGSGTSGNAYWRSGDLKLGTQPTGNKMTLLMAKLQNDSGGTIDGLNVAYALGVALTPGEEISGHRVYWSKTGLAGSWTAAGDFLRTTQGTTAVSFSIPSLAWANGDSLFIVWADDNGSNPDGDYTIDNVSFTPYTPPSGPSATITSPANGATVGAAFMIQANASTTSGTITSVTFYDGVTPIGTDTTSPYTYAWIGAPLGARALTAVALDSNGLSATSPVVNVTVVAGAGTLTRGPYLQMASSTQMTIRWRNSLQNLGRVNYGTSVGTLNQTVDESIAPAPAPASGFDHVVTLTGLTPNTTYFYSIGSGSDTLASGADYTFHTSPVPGTATNTRIWVVGDCGRGTLFQRDVRDAYYAWTGARTPDLCLQLGDNAYDSGTDVEYQTKFFDIYPTIFRKMPQWSTLGNHDANGSSTSPTANFPYFDMFTFPTAAECGGVASGTERYYSFDHGNIHVINLDSQTSSRVVDNPATPGTNEDGPMAAWLRADLASTTKTWIIVMFHHPPYSKGSHDSDAETQLIQMRANFGPIIEAGGVDLVLCGHSHSYERSKFIDSFYATPTLVGSGVFKNSGDGRPAGGGAYIKPLTGPRDHFGAVYSVPGSAGAVSGGLLNHPVMLVSYNTGGTLNLDINGNRLDATYVEKGPTTGTYTTPDTFTIIKQGAADSDNDGIPDAYEIAHGLNRFVPADASLDSDGDGVSNLAEFVFDTESNLSDKYAFSTSYDLLNGTNTITFETITGRTYRILYSNDLLSWQTASTSMAGTGATMMWVDDGTGTGSAPSAVTKRFYRVEVTVVP
jgi:hypothetical protein